jgi:RimJ/RimL family protein N-acetyltransferase
MRLRLERLIALIDPKNLASIRTVEKVGFAFEWALELAGNKFAPMRREQRIEEILP